MPERDSDRIVYEKLKDYKADYNSADWEQMESMLPQQGSRKPLYYSMAALLLLLLGSVGLWVGVEGIRSGSSGSEGALIQEKLTNEQIIGEQQVGSADQIRNTSSSLVQEEHQNQPLNSVIAEQVTHEKVFGKEAGAQASSLQSTTPQEERQLIARTYYKGGVKKQEEVIHKAASAAANTTNASTKTTGGRAVSEEVVHSSEGEMLASAVVNNKASEVSSAAFTGHGIGTEDISTVIAESGVAEGYHPGTGEPIFALNSIESGMIQIDGEATGIPAVKNALNGDAIADQKPKKQIVSFVMGAGAGMNFSFTDPALITKPGYSVDLVEELMFMKRIGIALTQSYADRRYDGGAYPCPDGVDDCPYSYSSNVRSVDFGVDIKANLVNKTKWSWYVKAGVINSVKIREDFSYHYADVDTITPPPTTLPPHTNFNGTTEEIMFDNQSFGLTADPIMAPDLTISGAKRYHIAYHATTGFDIAISPMMKMQLEAGHNFTQPIVGDGDKRLQSFGVSGKLLFRLSK